MDLPYTVIPKEPRKAKAAKDSLNAEQLRFCSKLLGDLHQGAHWASPSLSVCPPLIIAMNGRFLTTVLRLGCVKHSNPSGAYEPVDNAEEVRRIRVSRRPGVFSDPELNDYSTRRGRTFHNPNPSPPITTIWVLRVTAAGTKIDNVTIRHAPIGFRC